jgi:hypothetical protein
MRVPNKFGFAAATLLASTFGFVGLTQAAPLAGMADTVIALQTGPLSNETDGLIQKAHHKTKTVHHHHHHHHNHHHHHHPESTEGKAT